MTESLSSNNLHIEIRHPFHVMNKNSREEAAEKENKSLELEGKQHGLKKREKKLTKASLKSVGKQ